MPTILSVAGFDVVIWPNDHLPPHVHVFRAGTECRILIGVPGETPARLYDNLGRMREKDLIKAIELVAEHQIAILAHWRKIHG